MLGGLGARGAGFLPRGHGEGHAQSGRPAGGADSFTVFRDNFLFVNKGAAITGAVGVMACSR